MKSGHTTLTPIFTSVYLAAAMLQVSAGEALVFSWLRCVLVRDPLETLEGFYRIEHPLDLFDPQVDVIAT